MPDGTGPRAAAPGARRRPGPAPTPPGRRPAPRPAPGARRPSGSDPFQASSFSPWVRAGDSPRASRRRNRRGPRRRRRAPAPPAVGMVSPVATRVRVAALGGCFTGRRRRRLQGRAREACRGDSGGKRDGAYCPRTRRPHRADARGRQGRQQRREEDAYQTLTVAELLPRMHGCAIGNVAWRGQRCGIPHERGRQRSVRSLEDEASVHGRGGRLRAKPRCVDGESGRRHEPGQSHDA